jgi:hypothetical protein
MDRRQLLVGISLAMFGVSLSGCAGSSTDRPTEADTPTEKPLTSVDLTAVDATAGDPDVSLTIGYNATVTERIPTSPPTLADPGSKWLAVRMRVTNAGDTDRELTGYQYVVTANGETHEPVGVRADWSLFQADGTYGPTVAPGESATRWVIFSIPDETTDATLRIRENNRASYAVTFNHDGSLSAPLPGE